MVISAAPLERLLVPSVVEVVCVVNVTVPLATPLEPLTTEAVKIHGSD